MSVVLVFVLILLFIVGTLLFFRNAGSTPGQKPGQGRRPRADGADGVGTAAGTGFASSYDGSTNSSCSQNSNHLCSDSSSDGGCDGSSDGGSGD
ncbi:hypothetical protein HPT27_16065 [Permianibacter sp. IMCC34836]|uniref:hypothetical protein n=1 Tax=Permianibacter fluminis TaxID=2738515 RepID=UPI0015560C58|nr:hypothetical protein [Permianibacter fluminis]NQD38539.1 hypothetical protein [Permianibacter fluminis]